MNGPRRVFWIVGLVLLAAILTFALSGCSMFSKRPRITGSGVSVVGVPDAGKAATLDSGTSVASLPIPAGSSLVMTKTEAVAPAPATPDHPAVVAQPAKEVVEVRLAGPTEWRKTETTVKADTGTVDTSVAKHRIDVESAQPLLWASIGAAILAAVFVYIKYPTPALIFGGVSLIFFLSWKVSNMPWWFWVLGVFGAGAGLFLWFGHRRGENDGVKAALTGELETKTQTVVKPGN